MMIALATTSMQLKILTYFIGLKDSLMATPQKIKENISLAYVRAIAARAGANAAKPDDDYGIDIQIREVTVVPRTGGPRLVDGVTLDIQVKCSENVSIENGEVVYDLEAKTYNDLADTTSNTPRILVLLKIPEAESEWIHQDENNLLIRNCAYWLSLHGKTPTTNSSSQRVRIPVEQKFSPDTLSAFFKKIKNGETL